MRKLFWIIWVVPMQSQVSLNIKEGGRRTGVRMMCDITKTQQATAGFEDRRGHSQGMQAAPRH